MNPTAILTADWHLTTRTPRCRTDKSYLGTQLSKVEHILAISQSFGNIPILHAGDLGDKPEWPNWLLREFIMLKKGHEATKIIVVTGQHDLPQHRALEWAKTGVGVLDSAGIIKVIYRSSSSISLSYIKNMGESWGTAQINFAPFGTKVPPFKKADVDTYVLITHKLIAPNKDSIIGGEYYQDFIEAHPEYDLILVGDNHKTFVKRLRHTTLVSPGSLMRMSADQIDHRPCVFLWYAETNKVESCYIPIIEGHVSRDHIEEANAKEQRVNAFVEKVKGEGRTAHSFEANLERKMESIPDLKEGTQKKVWEAFNGDSE
ncbi:MAG: metallophosphoesterase [Syntrophorhabdaceae bacterium]|nr:metallophosphoesterase [Syntrophorhabdaceae bacterium]